MRTGGDSGPAMVAGKPDASLLIKAIRYNDTVQMPPGKKLKDEHIAALTAWVKMGAPWPATDPATRPVQPGKEFRISAEDRAFWSFQPVKEPPLPASQERRLAEDHHRPFHPGEARSQGPGPGAAGGQAHPACGGPPST